MARQWIKERKTALDTQSHRCTKWEIFPYPLNHFRQARKAFHSETEIISFLHPLSPHIPKSTKYANHSPLFPAYQLKVPLQPSLRLCQELLSLSTTAVAAPPWLFKRCDKPVQTALYTEAVLRRRKFSVLFPPSTMISSELYSTAMPHFLYYYFWKGQFITFV